MPLSNSRRKSRKGATLSLVAVCILMIVMIGLFFFAMIKLLGGSVEVNHTTDAGILNVAKNSLTKITVEIGGDLKYAIAPSQEVSLLNYNRLVAQAVLIALNAESLGPSAQANAKLFADQVTKVGHDLNEKLGDESVLADWFTALTYQNNTKLWNGNKVNASDILALRLRQGGSTNITIEDNLPEDAKELPHARHGTVKYLAGYVPLKLGLVGVPVFPSQNTHLVDPKEEEVNFKNVPANAFRVRSVAGVNDGGLKGGSLAAAIVGCVDKATDFPLSIPAGYIEIVNRHGTELPSTWQTTPNDENLFNNELFYPPGVTVAGCAFKRPNDIENNWSSVGFPCVFSQDEAAVRALYAYGEATLSNIKGVPVPVPPLPTSSSHPVYLAWAEDTPGTEISFPLTEEAQRSMVAVANRIALEGIRADTATSEYCRNCLDDLQEKKGLRYGCFGYLRNMARTYHRLPQQGDEYPEVPYFSAVDFLKGKVIHAFQAKLGATEDKPVHIVINRTTGLGKYPRGPRCAEPTPAVRLPLQRPASMMALIDQVAEGECDKDALLRHLLQRIREIDPKTTDQHMRQMLNTRLRMGETFYIYSPKPGEKVIISKTQPPSYSGLVPDGRGEVLKCANEYPLDGITVNTDSMNRSNELNIGDDYVRRKVYMNQEGSFTGTDKASFRLSSGYGNLLGRLEFSNHAEGEVDYWTPN